MTAIQFVLIAIAAFIVLAGLFMVMRSLKRRTSSEAAVIHYDKNGIPIIPRHERNVIDQPDFDDTIGGETTIVPNRDYLHAVIEDDLSAEDATYVDKLLAQGRANSLHSAQSDETDANYAHWQAQQQREDDTEFAHLSQQMGGTDQDLHGNQEPDAFSSLMSATDSLMPVIDMVEEPDFTETSPILDHHLQEPVNQEQNAPLINAKDNINITILPRQYRDRSATVIRGRDLLTLIDKYGLRFGAMNMFHRYEQKDGTGMLWFSMMGITDNGIAPFDPHSVATNSYNGIVVFLSLPHPQPLRSFDSMMSIAYMIANDLDAVMLDENNEAITPEYKQQLRIQVRDYDAN